MKTKPTIQQYEEILREAIDISLLSNRKIPQLYRESLLPKGQWGLRGLYLFSSKEENDKRPFLKVEYAEKTIYSLGLMFHGPRLTLEEAAQYLEKQNANPLNVKKGIQKVKRTLEKKAVN